MKNKICLLLCALLLLSCVPGLAGCSAAEQSPETPVVEPSPAAGEAAPWTGKPPSPRGGCPSSQTGAGGYGLRPSGSIPQSRLAALPVTAPLTQGGH